MNNKISVYIVGGDESYTGLFLDEIKIVSKIEDANIVLFTGGEDVSPGYYGEDIGKYTSNNENRDKKEFDIFKIVRKYNKLILGVCRGLI
jgi:gamma-glutamyl-gamma-aminobutyrate hydrolase PuuD